MVVVVVMAMGGRRIPTCHDRQREAQEVLIASLPVCNQPQLAKAVEAAGASIINTGIGWHEGGWVRLRVPYSPVSGLARQPAGRDCVWSDSSSTHGH